MSGFLSEVFIFIPHTYTMKLVSEPRNGTVRYESVMMLRNKLEELGKMKGVNQDEKGRGFHPKEKNKTMFLQVSIYLNAICYPDPEEFLNLLFKHILNVEPFVHIK